jgi:hypothetical protein
MSDQRNQQKQQGGQSGQHQSDQQQGSGERKPAQQREAIRKPGFVPEGEEEGGGEGAGGGGASSVRISNSMTVFCSAPATGLLFSPARLILLRLPLYAGAFGFLTFTQCAKRPGTVWRADAL